MAMWIANTDTPPPTKKPASSCRPANLTYLSSGLVVSLCRRDLLSALCSAGCVHLAIEIFKYLDSPSLLACSLVCTDWQHLLLSSIYTTNRFRRRVRAAIFDGRPITTRIELKLDMARAAIVDVATDDDFNIFALGLLAGRPHVMVCSLFGHGKRRWVHRFQESFDAASLTCIAAGQSLVALGCKDGKIRLYECNHQFRCLRLSIVLTHHTGAVRSIVFSDQNHIVSCSDDMTIGVVTILPNGALQLTKLLHGHVSRVRAINVQNGRILSGSDDRSVKLWSLNSPNNNTTTSTSVIKTSGKGSPPIFPASILSRSSACTRSSSTSEKPLSTMTGHSGPVTAVQLALPSLALSGAGSTVRLWNVATATCLKLLQHDEDSPVTTMTWISTFKGVATIDTRGRLRCFDLFDLETSKAEIVSATSAVSVHADPETKAPNNGNISPKQNSKFFNGQAQKTSENTTNYHPNIGPKDPKLSVWPDNAVFKLESIPHHFSAFSVCNYPLPTLTVHCLDYVH